ncbi:hypothetical protein Hamer_G013895 [Homarus americanus]|uniref:Fibronectin type III domain-containing protein n=1 Tax=Homarus americanus TaxID=6706 RepID=A0A8J5KJU5_HOMAM|nr:hypothetical protein Hamer_G013895 [Homarus americanus]
MVEGLKEDMSASHLVLQGVKGRPWPFLVTLETSPKLLSGTKGNNTSSPDPVTTPTPRDTHYTPSTTTTTITPPITINTIPTGTTPPQPTTAPAPTLPTTPKLLDRVSNMDDFQNDYIEDRPPPPSSSSSSSSTHLRYDHPFPEVIVPAGVPVYHEPRVPYGHHSRGLSPGGNFNKVPSPPAVSVGTVTVRVEEICLVLVVLMLWAGAITLFINRLSGSANSRCYLREYQLCGGTPRVDVEEQRI